MDEKLRTLVHERLRTLEAALPAEVELDAYLWDADLRDRIAQENRVAAEAYAWLQGVADAFDVLVTEIVEEAAAVSATAQ